MKNKIRPVLLLFVLLSVFVIFLFTYFNVQSRRVKTAFQVTSGASVVDLSFNQSIDGRIRWQLTAKTGEMTDEENRAVLEGISGRFYSPDQLSFDFEADLADIDMRTKNLVVKQKKRPVRLISSSGYKINAEKLVWLSGQRIVYSDGPVTMSGNGLNLNGESMVVNVDSGEIIFKNVHTRFKYR